jgi:16S rRNA (adenine1518-N6/adenine1519-N6)-dimethyltransferase
MADRIVSGPGTKDYGILSIFCALHTRPRLLFNVPPSAFKPKPRVDSSVVRFDVLNSPAVAVADEGAFKRVVKAAFNQRRKTLKNALRPVVADAAALDDAFSAAGIDPGRRGETLNLSEFARLTAGLAACIKENGND